MVSDLRAFGMPESEVERARAEFLAKAAPTDDFVIFGQNAAAVRLFLMLKTQWRTASLSTMSKAQVINTGLDYGAVRPAADAAGVVFTADDFARLRLMEAEALSAWAQMRKAAA